MSRRKARKTKNPDCYKCAYRREVPGSAHSSCAHPAADKATGANPMISLMGTLASVRGLSVTAISPDVQKAADKLGIVASMTGIRGGWFNWPVNFDPTWLEACKGFKE